MYDANFRYVLVEHIVHFDIERLSPRRTVSSSSISRWPASCRLFSSVAKHRKASSMLQFSLALVSNTKSTSGMYWHIASASSNSTSRRDSASALFPMSATITALPEYRRTSSIHLVTDRKDERFVMSYTMITPFAER